ncbi:hypothetical protein [Tropicimonas sp. S265A]|uniref:hypothetical protein n=1 Tax=Tropicimonas sp. S265A TaxID=3415134 RepID=UPI003C7BE170
MIILMGLKTGILLGAALASMAALFLAMKHLPALIDPSLAKRPVAADGSHCLSRTPAEHVGFMDALNARIDPTDRVVVTETRLGPLTEDGTHRVTVDYRFRKFSGVYTDGRATGTVRNDDCSFEIQTLER